MNNAPWLSILIPVYNVSAYIEACLNSVLTQLNNETGIEILALNDCSTDDSWATVQRLAQQHPQHISLLQHEHNRGLSAARNSLLHAAHGDYVWFLDSDDVLLSGALAALRKTIANNAPDLILCDFRLLREHSGLQHRLRGEHHLASFKGPLRSCDRNELIQGLLQERQLHAWSKIARRSIWQQAPFPEGRYFEDMAVIPMLVAATTRYAHLRQPCVGYRQRGDSILATMTPRKARDLLTSLSELHTELTRAPSELNASARTALDYFCLRTFATLARNLSKEDPGFETDCRQMLKTMFPNSTRKALQECRRRGWWLRAFRAQQSLAHAGWLT